MPLRDHFRPPVSKRSSWEGFHGGWPMRIVEELAPRLPEGFVAEPRVHLGSYYEIDVCTFEQSEQRDTSLDWAGRTNGGVATAPQAPPPLTFDAEFPEEYACEVLVFDIERERRLGAAVEIVSPANKDAPAVANCSSPSASICCALMSASRSSISWSSANSTYTRICWRC
jgi:hypothetical protein